MNVDYSVCKFSDLGNCGDRRGKKKIGIYKYTELKSSVLEHINFKNANMDVSECDLIQSRSGQTIQEFDQICAFHRYTYGKYCQHPEHKVDNFQRLKKSTALRPAS